MTKKGHDGHNIKDNIDRSIDNYELLEKKLIDLASENYQLNEEIDRLTFLLSQKSNRDKFGKVLIDVNFLVEILNFEKYIMNQSHVYLVHYDNKFLRIVPNYEISNQKIEIKEPLQKNEESKQEDKKPLDNFDSIV